MIRLLYLFDEFDPQCISHLELESTVSYSNPNIEINRKFLSIEIDQVCASLLNSQGINESLIDRIISFEGLENVEWRVAVKGLKLLLKLAMKNEFSPKTIGVYLMEKTILGTDLAEYMAEKFEVLKESKVSPPSQAKMQDFSWAAFNLKQSTNKQTVNKMYMKMYLRTLEGGREEEKTFNCQLPEFKLLLSQVSEIQSNMK